MFSFFLDNEIGTSFLQKTRISREDFFNPRLGITWKSRIGPFAMVSRPFMQQRSDLGWIVLEVSVAYGLWLLIRCLLLLGVCLGYFLAIYAYHMRKLYIFHKLYSSSSRMIRLYFHSQFDVYPAWETPNNCMYISSWFIGSDFRGTPGNPTVQAWACGSDPVPLWGRSRRKDHEKPVVKLRYWTKILDKWILN